MTGYVDDSIQPKVKIAVQGQRREQIIETVIDTGFNGGLCLPISVAVQLGLELAGSQLVELADGSVHRDLIFAGSVMMNNKKIIAEISLTESEESLLGTGLLKGQRLEIGFESRTVSIGPETSIV